MKKILLSIVAMMTVIVAVFAVGCSAYDGNYVEATPEQKEAARAKLQTAVEKEETTNYELTGEFDVKTTSGDGEITAKGKMSALSDCSDKDDKLKFFEIDLTYVVTEHGETVTTAIKMNYYVEYSTEKVYLDYTIESSKKGSKTSESKQIVTTFRQVESFLSTYLSVFGAETGNMTDLYAGDLIDLLDDNDFKFYVDGDKKFKWVNEVSQHSKVEFYLVLNDNGTYRSKLEADVHIINVSVSNGNQETTVAYTEKIEVLPTGKKIKLPNKDDYVG